MISILIASMILVVVVGGISTIITLGAICGVTKLHHYMKELERKDGTNGNH